MYRTGILLINKILNNNNELMLTHVHIINEISFGPSATTANKLNLLKKKKISNLKTIHRK